MPALLAYIALLAVAAPAQPSGASLSGIVEDRTGASIPGVNLTLKSDLGIFTATSNDRGSYAFDTVPPGSYQLLAYFPGFVTRTLSVTLAEGEQASRQIQLEVGMGCGPNACCIVVAPMPTERNISGLVVDERGRAIRNAIVSLYGAATPPAADDGQHERLVRAQAGALRRRDDRDRGRPLRYVRVEDTCPSMSV